MRVHSTIRIALGCFALLVFCLATQAPTAAVGIEPAVVLEDAAALAADAEQEQQRVARWKERAIFYLFLVVALVVPVIMARRLPAKVIREESSVSFFTSDRERRLWLWAAAALGVIYFSLSPAQELAAALRERGVLNLTSGIFLLLVAIAVVVHWARTRPGRFEIAAGIGLLAIFTTIVIRLPVPEARSHLFEYALVATLIYHALLERRANGRPVPVPAVVTIVATGFLGWLDEGIQAILPNRVYDLHDVGLNVAFATGAVVGNAILSWARGLDILKRVGIRPE